MVREFAPGLEVPLPPPPAPPAFLRRHLVTVALALVGGVFASLGAFIEEARSAHPLLLFLVAPAIEEVLKPSGVIWLLEKRPHYLLSPVHAVLLCVLGALVFAGLENLVYIYVYAPDQGAGFVRFRLLVCTGLHAAASALVGIGLGRQLTRMRRDRSDFDLENSLPFLIAAIALHAAYNATVFFLERAGWKPWA